MFLDKRAAASFGQYADAQLRRLQNAIARGTLSRLSCEKHILKSIQHTLDDFNRRYKEDEENQARIFIDGQRKIFPEQPEPDEKGLLMQLTGRCYAN